MKRIVFILIIIISINSCTKDRNENTYYYFNAAEQNFLGFELNNMISFTDNNGNELVFKVVKDSLYHRKLEHILGGISFVQHNDIRLVSVQPNNYFIRIEAEKSQFFDYLIEMGEFPVNQNSYFYFNYSGNGAHKGFEIIDTTINTVNYSGLYALRAKEFTPNVQNNKSLILMNSQSGIVLIEKKDENSNVLFKLKKK